MIDKVTGFAGVVTSVTFDLYGCVQALLTPGLVDGKLQEQAWFDVKRLKDDALIGRRRVMDVPRFGAIAFGSERGGDAHPKLPQLPLPP